MRLTISPYRARRDERQKGLLVGSAAIRSWHRSRATPNRRSPLNLPRLPREFCLICSPPFASRRVVRCRRRGGSARRRARRQSARSEKRISLSNRLRVWNHPLSSRAPCSPRRRCPAAARLVHRGFLLVNGGSSVGCPACAGTVKIGSVGRLWCRSGAGLLAAAAGEWTHLQTLRTSVRTWLRAVVRNTFDEGVSWPFSLRTRLRNLAASYF